MTSRCAAPRPSTGWPVLIADNADAAADGIGQQILVQSGGVATSGTTTRRWRRGEVELHHVIDPATGRPAAEYWRTATVAAASCVDANVASTASIVMGDDAPAWLEARRLPARLVAPRRRRAVRRGLARGGEGRVLQPPRGARRPSGTRRVRPEW